MQAYSKRRLKICAGFFLVFISMIESLSAADIKLNILALGDSTTAGTPGFRSPVENPPNGSGNEQSQYTYWMIKKHPEWKILNRGVNGERTDQILMRFKKYITNEKPQIVIVLAGVNDLYQGAGAQQVENQLEQIYTLAIKNRIQVVACTILPYDRAVPAVVIKLVQVNAWIQEFSKIHGFLFCDTAEAVRDPQNPWKLASSPDGLHPDVQGYRKMGEALAEVISKRNS